MLSSCLSKLRSRFAGRCLPPESGAVHVWRVCLNAKEPAAKDLFGILSPDERRRAERFYREKERRNFIAARGALRIILSRYAGVSPDRIEFFYNPHGKPFLDESIGNGLRFNVSHSKDVALYGLTREREIGIDIEFINEKAIDGAVAARVFSKSETAFYESLVADAKPDAFFDLWTRREALLKAVGTGFARTAARKKGWTIKKLRIDDGYAAAVAVNGSIEKISRFEFERRAAV